MHVGAAHAGCRTHCCCTAQILQSSLLPVLRKEQREQITQLAYGNSGFRSYLYTATIGWAGLSSATSSTTKHCVSAYIADVCIGRAATTQCSTKPAVHGAPDPRVFLHHAVRVVRVVRV